MREFAFIEAIRQRAQSRQADELLSLGIGDDAAVFPQRTGYETLITTDLLIEDVDFKREYAVPEWLGHKVLAVSLSDIAAMGGIPRFSLLSLGIPRTYDEEFWNAFFDGYFALADASEVRLIGGDTSASPDRLVVDSIVTGECQRGCAVRRSGASIGHDIWVTGTIGGAHCGLRQLLNGSRVDDNSNDLLQRALRRHLRPEPPLSFGMRLGELRLASSMIDVSDGLAQDLEHICIESGVGAELDAEKLPVAAEMTLTTSDASEAVHLALNGGEDFELLFTASVTVRDQVKRLAEACAVQVTLIGRVIERADSSLYLLGDGGRTPLTPHGYEHFV